MKHLRFSLIALAGVLAFGLAATAQIQSWDTEILGSGRFKVLADFANAAVLDKETGLVWERSPDTHVYPWSSTTATTANIWCNVRNIGNRLGWRLPTIQELASLLDITQFRPSLPVGHPFILNSEQQGQTCAFAASCGSFWSTTNADIGSQGDLNHAWYISFYVLASPPLDGPVFANGLKTDSFYVWCVRGGQGINPQ